VTDQHFEVCQTNQQLNLIQLNIVASWRFYHHDYLHTIFILSTLYFVCCTHICAIFLWQITQDLTLNFS